jgi:hypothetical protein
MCQFMSQEALARGNRRLECGRPKYDVVANGKGLRVYCPRRLCRLFIRVYSDLAEIRLEEWFEKGSCG